ncbi:MAG: 30S ribosomal protein S6 [Candidatus Gracilibacteria bacterium]|jgi:small subunit ribosomal protein S6
MNNTVLSDAKRYELMVIINPDIGEDDIKKRLDKVRKQITSVKGEIFHEELWGLKDLAYAIGKQRKGYYAVLDFVSDPQHIKEMDRVLRLEPEVVRHMFITLPTTYVPKDYTVVVEEALVEGKTDDKKPYAKVEPKAEPKVEPKVEPKAKPEEKVEAAEETTKKKKKDLEDVDAKLKSIIDNPDLNF